jgi:hypothetical protein
MTDPTIPACGKRNLLQLRYFQAPCTVHSSSIHEDALNMISFVALCVFTSVAPGNLQISLAPAWGVKENESELETKVIRQRPSDAASI